MAGFPISILDPAESSDSASGIGGDLLSALLSAGGGGIGALLGGLGADVLGPLLGGLFSGGVPTTAKTSAVASDLSGSGNPDDQLLGQFMGSLGINNNNVLSNPAYASKTNRMADLIEALTGTQLPNWQAKGSTGEITGFTGSGFSTPANIMGVESEPQAAGSIFGTPGASPNLTAAQVAQLMPQLQQIANSGKPITAAQLQPLIASVAGSTASDVGDVNDYLNQGSGGSGESGNNTSNISLNPLSILSLLGFGNLFGNGSSSGGATSSENPTNPSTAINLPAILGAALKQPQPTAPRFSPTVIQA